MRAAISVLYAFANVLVSLSMITCGHYVLMHAAPGPVLNGFVVVGKSGRAHALVLWCRSTRWELAMMCASRIDRLWELFEFTAAAAAVYDHTPQRLGRRVPDP